MTSEERREGRYQRRKAKRKKVEQDVARQYADPDKIFSTSAIVKGFKKSRRASGWKASTQAFGSNLFINASRESRNLYNGSWKPKGFYEFDIIERGKPRHIQSVCMAEKCVQSALSNECLVPILGRSLIYDNGASLKDKGTDFALNRFIEHLRWHYRRYGREGGIYFFDFKGYFSHIKHYPLKQRVRDKIKNEAIIRVYNLLIDAFRENGISKYDAEGLGLGSQVSQISAVFYPNSVDHWVKDTLGIHCYARYMDDGYIILPDIDRLKAVAKRFEALCFANGILPNRKKCRIIKLTKQFAFLKVRFFLTETGKVVRRLSRDAITKARRRLRKLRSLLIEGRITFQRINQEFHAWLCSLVRGKSYYITQNMIRYFDCLFSSFGRYSMPVKRPKRRQKKRYRLIRSAMTASRAL